MKFIVLILFVILVFLTMDSLADIKTMDGINNKYNKEELIKGFNLIKDSEAQQDIMDYLYLHEKFDFEKIYFYLSNRYLNKYFPEIKNEKDYSSYRNNHSELGNLKYIELLNWKMERKGQCELELIYEVNSEGDEMIIKAIYIFVNEDGKWKFDGEKNIESKILEE